MLPLRRHHPRPVARRLAVALCCAAYLAASLGYPVAVRQDKLAPGGCGFACASRACGCSSAEQCRHACCCSKSTAPEPEPDEAPCCKGEGHSCCAKPAP